MSALSEKQPSKEKWMTHDPNNDIKRQLSQNHSCYVLITCGEVNPEGEIQVDMTYEGDPTLASFLLRDAQKFIDERTG